MPFLIAGALIAAIILAASYAVYRIAFYNKNDKDVTYNVLSGEDYDSYHDGMLKLIDDAVKLPYEEVFTDSYDGLKLFGRVYFRKKGAPFHIEFNGYKGNGIRDFSGGMQLALSLDENVLLVDQRAHGRSQGHTITFGVKERKDVLSWIDFVLTNYGKDTDIYLEGVSMGAATVLTASDLDLPSNVKGIIADCPFSDPLDIVSFVADEKTHIKNAAKPFIFLGALLFGGFNIKSASAVKAVAKTHTPILIIHGTGDHYVPVDMSRKIHDANPDLVELTEVDGAPHGLSYMKDYGRYRKAFLSFIEKTRA